MGWDDPWEIFLLSSSLTTTLPVFVKWNSAKDLMTTDIKTVGADWPVNRVAQFLVDHDISGPCRGR